MMYFKSVGDEAVYIKVILDIFDFITLRGGVEVFYNLPGMSIYISPFYGWNMFVKRLTDITIRMPGPDCVFSIDNPDRHRDRNAY